MLVEGATSNNTETDDHEEDIARRPAAGEYDIKPRWNHTNQL